MSISEDELSLSDLILHLPVQNCDLFNENRVSLCVALALSHGTSKVYAL